MIFVIVIACKKEKNMPIWIVVNNWTNKIIGVFDSVDKANECASMLNILTYDDYVVREWTVQ